MDHDGGIRSKRKASPVSLSDRPAKLFKAQMPGPKQNGETSHAQLHDMETDSEDDSLPLHATATADSAEWQATIEKVVRNVVSIHFCQTCSFDTDPAVSSEATGFVVDAQRGYILTNRHVVGAGPFWGYCIFDNHEEVYEAQ
jgi:S1-C subfamily serine protease